MTGIICGWRRGRQRIGVSEPPPPRLNTITLPVSPLREPLRLWTQSYLTLPRCQQRLFWALSWAGGPGRSWAGTPADKADRDTVTCMSVDRVGMDEARPANGFFLAFDRSNRDHAVVEGRFAQLLCCTGPPSRRFTFWYFDPFKTELAMTTKMFEKKLRKDSLNLHGQNPFVVSPTLWSCI